MRVSVLLSASLGESSMSPTVDEDDLSSILIVDDERISGVLSDMLNTSAGFAVRTGRRDSAG
jgi:hypothetical protein